MKLLVSVCSRLKEESNLPGLLIIDFSSKKIQNLKFDTIPLSLKDHTFNGKLICHALGRMTGLSFYKGQPLVMSCGNDPQALFTFNQKEITNVWLPEVIDPHSIYCIGDYVWVTATGTNEIHEFNLTKCIRAPYYSRAKAKNAKWARIYHTENRDITTDKVHLNSLTYFKGDFYVSAFGPKEDSWGHARNGYVKSLHGDNTISAMHPHSLVAHNSKLYFCESAEGRVRTFDGEITNVPDAGYIRGLAFFKTKMFVGSSQSRKFSKSTGKQNYPSADGDFIENCSIYCYELRGKLKSAKLKHVIDLNKYANEIYDILVLN